MISVGDRGFWLGELATPLLPDVFLADLLMQLDDAVEQGIGPRGAAWACSTARAAAGGTSNSSTPSATGVTWARAGSWTRREPERPGGAHPTPARQPSSRRPSRLFQVL